MSKIHSTWSTVILATALLIFSPTASQAQGGGCLPQDNTATTLHSYGVTLATSSDPSIIAKRDGYGILPVEESEVEIETDSKTCKKAAREYKSALGLSGPAPAVHAIRVGTRFIVVSPETYTSESEFITHVVFDDKFNELARFAS